MAAGVLRKLKSQKVVATWFLLSDIVAPLEVLSQLFQSDDILPHHAARDVGKTIEALNEMVSNNDDARLEAVFAFLVSCHNQKGSVASRKGELGALLFALLISSFAKQLVSEMVSSLEKRFDSLDVLTAFGVFDPASYRVVNPTSIKQYGGQQLGCLVQHFCGGKKQQKLFDVDDAEGARGLPTNSKK